MGLAAAGLALALALGGLAAAALWPEPVSVGDYRIIGPMWGMDLHPDVRTMRRARLTKLRHHSALYNREGWEGFNWEVLLQTGWVTVARKQYPLVLRVQ